MAISRNNEARLRAALDRLTSNEPTRSNGKLTVAALAAEAGLSRDTVYRAPAILHDLRTQIGQRDNARQAPQDRDDATSSTDHKSRLNRELADLRHQLSVYAQHIRALTLENQALRQARDQSSTLRPISPISPKRT